LSCSDDMSVGVVSVMPDGSLMLSKLLHGHVSRVRALDSQADMVLSGSDDRSVKLWSLLPGILKIDFSSLGRVSEGVLKVLFS
jgi:WD40 repeat protein